MSDERGMRQPFGAGVPLGRPGNDEPRDRIPMSRPPAEDRATTPDAGSQEPPDWHRDAGPDTPTGE